MEVIFLLSVAALSLLGIVAILRSDPGHPRLRERPVGGSAKEVAEHHFAEIAERQQLEDGSQLITGRPRYHWPHQIKVGEDGISAGAVSKTHDGKHWQKAQVGEVASKQERHEMNLFAAQLDRHLPEGSPVRQKDATSEPGLQIGDAEIGES